MTKWLAVLNMPEIMVLVVVSLLLLVGVVLYRRQRAKLLGYQAILNSSPGFIFEVDSQERFVSVHTQSTDELMLSPNQFLGRTLKEVLPEEAYDIGHKVLLEVGSGLTRSRSYQYSLPFNGEVRWYEVQATSKQGWRRRRVLLWVHDITPQKLALADHKVSAIALETRDAVIITDSELRIVRVNQAFTEITGYLPEDVVGKRPSLLSSGHHDGDFYRQMWETLEAKREWAGEIRNRRKNGELFTEQVMIKAVSDSHGKVTHYIASFSDVTDQKKNQELIQQLAYYDPLTRLANRRLLLERLDEAQEKSLRTGRLAALLFLDLDHFKKLNDTLGHAMGDELLVQVAQRLRACSRSSDVLARPGGDEFIVLIEDLPSEKSTAAQRVQAYGEKVLEALHEPYDLQGQAYALSASLGIELFQGKAKSRDELLASADLAMYEAKQSGRNQLRFFELDMQERLEQRKLMDAELKQALGDYQFQVFIQPRVDVEARTVSHEALLRWDHPERGLLLPGQFLEAAESTGLILDIGEAVLEAACRCLHRQITGGERPTPISINLSRRQLLNESLVGSLSRLLATYGLDASLLELEISERQLEREQPRISAQLNRFKAMGIRLLLDDFGTGCLSLPRLRELPFSAVKIDRSIIARLGEDEETFSVVEAMIGAAHVFQLVVIAEGVETEEQLRLLKKLGCDQFQGFYYAEPAFMTQGHG